MAAIGVTRAPAGGDAGLRVGVALLGLLAAALGLLAGRSPVLAIGLAVALTFVGLVLADVTTGFVLFTFVAFLEVLPGFGGGLSFAKFAGLTLVLSWLATTATSGPDRRSFVSDHPVAAACAVLFLAWTAASALWAEAPRTVFGAFFRYAPNLFLLPIAYTALRVRRSVVVFALVFVGTALMSAIYGIAVPSSSPTAADRLSGAGVDPNILAMTLVGATAVAAGLAAMPGNPRLLRASAGVAAGLCVLAILGTVSRGGIISLAFMLVLAAAFSGRERRTGMIALLIGVTLTAGVYVAAIAPSYVRERITQSDGGAGRSDLWTIGWRMVQNDPLLGVGAGNFPIVSVHYLLRPGTITRSDFIVDNPKVAHNIYLEIPAELGIVGLALFLAIVGFALRCGVSGSRAFAARGDRDMEILSRAIVLGAAGMLTANLFISQQFNKPLWLLLAVCPALLAIAREDAA